MKNKLLILLITSLFITSSCINYTELNDIGIINTMGINKINNNYILNINVLTPTEDNTNKSITLASSGSTITEAYNKLYLTTTKKINLSHLDLLILSNNLEKKDYIEIKNFFLSKNDSRNNFNIIILENYNISNIFKYSALDINSLIKTNSKEIGTVTPKTFDEMIQDIMNIDKSYIPTIKIDDKMEILGYRIIYNNKKLLNIEESNTLNYLTNKINKCTLSFKNNSIKVESNNTSISVNNNVINITIFSTISEQASKNTKDMYKSILKERINNYIKNNDIDYFYNLAKKYNKNYYRYNKELSFNININSKLIRVNNYE